MLALFSRLSHRGLERRVASYVSVSTRRRAVEIESEGDFQKKVIQSDTPVIVDFYAT